MPIPKYDTGRFGQAGYTIIEIIVSSGLAGVIMVALMFLFSQSGKFSGRLNAEFVSIEGISDAVALFNNVIPQTTRIQTCNCQANTSSRANCIWSSSSPWYDPVMTGGATSPVTILSGEYEAYNGSQSLTSMGSLTTSSISIPGETCASSSSNLTSANLRGCKLSYTLVYTAPVAESGSTASFAGQLKLNFGSKKTQIGLANKNGAGGLGISTLACGFESSAGGVTGTNFVLNLNIKVRSNSILDVSNSYYESWYPQSCTGSNSRCKGLTRPLLLKYSMRNLTQRGLYLWRSEGFKRCKQPGDTASSAAECCSQAWNGTACALCLASGQAATVAAACCSGDLNGAVCR